MHRETAIGICLFLMFFAVVGMAAPVIADALLHAKQTAHEAAR